MYQKYNLTGCFNFFPYQIYYFQSLYMCTLNHRIAVVDLLYLGFLLYNQIKCMLPTDINDINNFRVQLTRR